MTIVPGFGLIAEEDYPEYAVPLTIEVIEAQPIPDLPAEVWNKDKPDGSKCMAAVRSLCGG